MNTTIETIGPAYAEILLKRNTQNRPMQPHHVTYLVREMESARWMENGEPIIIGEDGLIKDGQHRLQAIIRSGKSYKFVIVRDVASNVQEVGREPRHLQGGANKSETLISKAITPKEKQKNTHKK